MSIYSFWEGHHRRRFLRGGFVPFERKRCSCGAMPPKPESKNMLTFLKAVSSATFYGISSIPPM